MNDHLKNGSLFPSCIHSLYQRITRIRLPYTSEDRMIAPDNQKRMSTRMGARKVITLATSHASLASKPIEVASAPHDLPRSSRIARTSRTRLSNKAR